MSKEAKKEAIRKAMPSDMAAFLDEWREEDHDMKLTSLYTPTLVLGRPGEHGLSVADMVIREKGKK